MTIDLDKLVQALPKQYQYISRENDSNISFDALVNNIISYYENIIGCMPGNVYWFDSNLIAVGCNKNVLKMFGFKSIAEFRGLTFEEMGIIGHWTHEATTKFKNDTLEVLKTGQPKLNLEEPPIPHNDGGMIYFISNRVPIFDAQGNVAGVVGISIDITERKKIEQALAAKEIAESASRAKSEFIANMSHDIRTPLSGMIGMAQAILTSSQEPITKQYAEVVVTASKQLLQLLNSILEVSKIDKKSKHANYETFNLEILLHELIELLKPSFIEKNLEFNLTYDKKIPTQLKGKAKFIHRVLLNILGNAIKFTNTGHIQLIAELISKEKDTAVIKLSIIDTGIGINEQQLEKIYEPFTRLDPSYNGAYEGSGLGLYITKRFVEYLKGQIDVTSVPGVGSTFVVTLPLYCDRSLQKYDDKVKAQKKTSCEKNAPPSQKDTDILKNQTSSLTQGNRIEKDNLAIDIALGESIVGTRERAMEMLAMLKNDIHDNLPLMEQYYQASQWNELKVMIHKFYGGVCFCGTPYLKIAVHELDHALKEKNREYSEIVNSFELFATEIKRFLMAYERLI